MSDIVRSRFAAGSGAAGHVIRRRTRDVELRVPHVRLGASAIREGLDGAVAEPCAVEAVDFRDGVAGVAVGACDYDVEVLPVLAGVLGFVGGDGVAEEGALDECGGGRVGAIGPWVGAGCVLEEYVEGCAVCCVVALGGALVGVVAVQCVVGKVALGDGRSL